MQASSGEDRQRLLRFEASDDLLIFNLTLESIRDPFQVGGFVVHPTYDLRRYLRGYDREKVAWVIQSETKYAQFTSVTSPLRNPTDLFITSLRLLKPGWIEFAEIRPVTRGYGFIISKELDYPPPEQTWSDPMAYRLKRRDIPRLRRIHQRLSRIPASYLDVAIRRFNRSYGYWTHPQLDDCYVDLWIALESMGSCERSRIAASVKQRVSELLGRSDTHKSRLRHDIEAFWSHRCAIVHGQETTQSDFVTRWNTVERLRKLVRNTIMASIALLDTAGQQSESRLRPMARVIDDYLQRHVRPSS